MNNSILLIVGVLVVGPVMAAPRITDSGPQPAKAVAAAEASGGVRSVHDLSAGAAKNLGTIEVNGQILSPICSLDFIKMALHTAYSPAVDKADQVVCRFVTPTGSHIPQYLWCETNAQMTKDIETLRGQRSAGGVGGISVMMLEAKLPRVNVSALKMLMRELPEKPLVQCN